MKTPMQELIEVLKIHRDTAFEKEKRYPNNKEYYEGRAKAFEDAISFAEEHLEKEKEVMCEFAWEYERECRINLERSIEKCWYETFKTNEK